jgi:carbon starvation protein
VDLTSAGFISNPEVATSSILYILLALLFGLSVNRWGLNLRASSFIFVPLVFFGIYAGHLFPFNHSWLPGSIGMGQAWNIILLMYCVVASITPVWILLQPRDYLSSFLLYGSILGALAGILLGGFEVHYPMFTGWISLKDGSLFPILFITIACGACSGFHCLVASGTTSKQLDKETHARPIGYGAMLIEGVVAVISLLTVVILLPGSGLSDQDPLNVYGNGLGHFLEVIGMPFKLGKSFGVLAVSTFLLTTLDTATRLGRYIIEEFFNFKNSRSRYTATLATIFLPLVFTFLTFYDKEGNIIPAWKAIWPVFGATNQLLAALALLVVYVWLKKTGKGAFFIQIPMILMFVMTLWALGQLILHTGFTLVGMIALLLLVLSLVLLFEAIRTINKYRPETN